MSSGNYLLPMPAEDATLEDLEAYMKEHGIAIPSAGGRGRTLKRVRDDVVFHVETINRRLKRKGLVASPSPASLNRISPRNGTPPTSPRGAPSGASTPRGGGTTPRGSRRTADEVPASPRRKAFVPEEDSTRPVTQTSAPGSRRSSRSSPRMATMAEELPDKDAPKPAQTSPRGTPTQGTPTSSRRTSRSSPRGGVRGEAEEAELERLKEGKQAEAEEARAMAEAEAARAKKLREEQAERARAREAKARDEERAEEKRKEDKRKADRQAMMQQTPLRSGSHGISLEDLRLGSPAPIVGTGAESTDEAMELHHAAELLSSPALKSKVDPKTEERLKAKVAREEREKSQVANWMQEERDHKERILDDNAHHKAMIGLLQEKDLPDKLSEYIDRKDMETTIRRLNGEVNRLKAENRIAEVKLSESLAAAKEDVSAARRNQWQSEGLVRIYKKELVNHNIPLPSEDSPQPGAEAAAASKASATPGLLKKAVAIVIFFLVIRQLLFQATSTIDAPICFY